MGLLDASYSAVNTKKPRKSDRILPATELNARGLLDAATNVPIAGDALSGVLAAYDAAKGDYGSAAVNALGVLPFVSGTFIGKGAKTWDAVKAAEAAKRIDAGENAAKVWKETGYGKAPWDKAARSEIDDSKAKILGGKLPTREIDGFGSVEDWKLPDAFSHEALYSAYPNTKNIESSFFNGKPHLAEYMDFGDGWISYSNSFKKPLPSQSQSDKYNAAKQAVKDFDSRPNVVAYNEELQSLDMNTPDAVWDDVFNKHNGSQIEAERKPLVDSMLKINSEIKNNPQGGFGLLDNDPSKSTTLHELQHAIQQREGWARGGSAESMAEEIAKADAVRGKFKQAATQAMTTTDDIARQNALQEIEYYRARLNPNIEGLTPSEAYSRLAGEAEARLTQARMNLSPEQRLAQYPYDPEYFRQATGVDINNLIVRGDGGKAMSLLDDVRPMTEYEKRHEIARQNAVKMLGLPENNTAMDRAKAMGFDTPAYHGTNADVPKFDMSLVGSSTVLPLGAPKGAYFAKEQSVAGRYARGSDSGANVMPVMLNKDGALLDNSKIVVTDKPENIRSRFAAFDPMRRHEADLLGYADPYLLGGIGAGGLLGLGAYKANQE